MRIGEMLVQGGFITSEQLQSALTVQQIYGGRIGTNLVELGLVSEIDLARVLSSQLGVRMVERDALLDIHPRILALVPANVAIKYQIVPFGRDERSDRVWLALADPTNLHAVDEIQFALGKRVELFICPEITLSNALERYYHFQREKRFIRIQAGGVASQPNPRGAAAAAPPTDPTSTGRLRRGPSGEDLLAAIVAADSRESVLDATIEILLTLAGQVVFLAEREVQLTGWRARGLPVSAEQVAACRVPTAASATVAALAAEGRPRRIRLASDPVLEGPLGEELFLDDSDGALLLPLAIGERMFGLFALGSLRPEALPQEPLVLVELMRRVAWRLRAIQLMERVAAPLVGFGPKG